MSGRSPVSRATNEFHPLFGLYRLQPDFQIVDCDQTVRAALAHRLEELSQMTWNEILLAPRQGLGTEMIAQASIRRPVPPFVTPDVRLLACRFGAGARIIGFREDEVFHLLWIDPHHRMY